MGDAMNEIQGQIERLRAEGGEGAARAAAARAAADGEAPGEGVDASRVGFERELRSATGRAMGSVEVPAGLADRVRAAIAADADARAAQDAEFAGRMSDRAVETKDRSFWASGGRTIAALAAGVALAFGGIWGYGLITNSGQQQVAQGDPEAFMTALAGFVAQEHLRTVPESVAERKFRVTDAAEAPRVFRASLGESLTLPAETEQLTLRGASNCKVPGTGKSAHFQFVVDMPEALAGSADHLETEPGKVLVSIFVKANDGSLSKANGEALAVGKTYEIKNPACGESRVLAWTDGDLVYVMVAKDCDAKAAETMLETLSLPEPEDLI